MLFDEFLSGNKKLKYLSLNSNNGRENNFGKIVSLRENQFHEAQENEKSLNWLERK